MDDSKRVLKVPKLKKDWEGRYVRLLKGSMTYGGIRFDVGEIMRVKRNYNGLHLERVTRCPTCWRGRRETLSAQEWQVELLPLDFKLEPEPVYIAMTPVRLNAIEHVLRDGNVWEPVRVIFDDIIKEVKG